MKELFEKQSTEREEGHKISRKNSILTKTALMVVIVIVFIGIIFGSYRYNNIKSRHIEELQDLEYMIVNRLALNLVIPLWEVDSEWVREIIAAEMENKHVLAVKVTGEGDLFEGFSRDDLWRRVDFYPDISVETIASTKDVVKDNEVIGSLTLYITKRFMTEALNQEIINVLTATLFSIAIFLIFFYFLLRIIIINPGSRILEAANTIAKGDFSRKVDIRSNDEIGYLAHAINAMSRSLGENFEALQKKNIDLEKSRQHLKEAEENYRNIFENAHEGIFQVKRRSGRVNVNPSLLRILGLQTEDRDKLTYGKIIQYLFPDHEELEKFLSVLRENGEVDSFESESKRKDGSRFWFSISAHLVKNSNNDVVYTEGSIIDITQRKQKEQALKEKEAAEETSKAKSAFLANMSHDLRTPLNAILGYSQIFKKAPNLTKDQKDDISIVYQSGHHLLTLINDILEFSRMEAGKLELLPEDINFPSFLGTIVGIMKMSARQKGLEFVYEPAPDLPILIKADDKRLRQVLINLLGNAVKYTDTGHVFFRVKAFTDDENKENSAVLRFEVEDTGIGISKDKLGKIFSHFEQAGENNRREEGAGLGLAISQQLANLMGGHIEVKSDGSRGSVFSFEIKVSVLSCGPIGDKDMEDFTEIHKGSQQKESLPDSSTRAADGQTSDKLKIIPPEQEDLEEIYQMAILGKMKPIREKADQLRKTNEKYIPFADKLRTLARTFEDKQIVSLVSAYLNGDI